VSLPARFARFVLTTGLVAVGRRCLERHAGRRWSWPALALLWTVVYSVYFTLRGTV
jgi:hypothetical protein